MRENGLNIFLDVFEGDLVLVVLGGGSYHIDSCQIDTIKIRTTFLGD
jgi:hypothetical protein